MRSDCVPPSEKAIGACALLPHCQASKGLVESIQKPDKMRIFINQRGCWGGLERDYASGVPNYLLSLAKSMSSGSYGCEGIPDKII